MHFTSTKFRLNRLRRWPSSYMNPLVGFHHHACMSHADSLAVWSIVHSQVIASTSSIVTIFLLVFSSSGRKDSSIGILLKTQHTVGWAKSHFSVNFHRLGGDCFSLLLLLSTCEHHFCWSLSCAPKPNCRGVVPRTPDPCNPPIDRRLSLSW